MFKNIFVYSLALFILPFAGNAQDVPATSPSPRVIGKFSPINLIDFSPAVQGGIEFKVGRRIYWQHEAGYIFGLFPFSESTKGFRLRTEVREYTRPLQKGQSNLFFGAQLSWRHTVSYKEDYFCRYDCAYQQLISYTRPRNQYSGTFNFGVVWFISPTATFELSTGLGVKYLEVRTEGIPADATEPNDNFDFQLFNFELSDGYYWRPSLILGVKFGKVFN